MFTVTETDDFVACAAGVWTDAQREDFIVWIAENPLAGAVIPGTADLRKFDNIRAEVLRKIKEKYDV